MVGEKTWTVGRCWWVRLGVADGRVAYGGFYDYELGDWDGGEVDLW